MHLASIRIRNYRRLRNVRIDLAHDTSIFVGANNSGKTSACHALKVFSSGSKDRFRIYDFSSECWPAFDAYGAGTEGTVLPVISLDLWFQVEARDLYCVRDLLPSLTWRGSMVGLRIEFAAADPDKLRTNFTEAHALARASIPSGEVAASYHPWPEGLRDYLDKHLHREYELRYYVLDQARFSDELIETTGYTPQPLTVGEGKSGRDVLNSLLRVDFLHAQRYLSDSAEGSRAEDLSHRFSRFYEQNLDKRAADYSALKALADSERHLDAHLQEVFRQTLSRISTLGYPGIANPHLLIKSALNPASIMSSQDGARLHYSLTEPRDGAVTPTLPDQYNGLGFKNLIYMVVELLDLQNRWRDTKENRPLIHLICIEEPEAHMHAQLQQVFIREVYKILIIEGDDTTRYKSQLLVTTHSPHILYERGFRPIRYFRRQPGGDIHSSEVLNLSAYYDQMDPSRRDFLERYMKLTHCDLFFADAAILVEGNVERLLLPEMIGKVARRLQSTYCSILEIGGAYGFRFKSLIEFLGITTLIITDIDSVKPPAGGSAPTPTAEGDTEKEEPGTACMVSEPGAVTSNQTVIQWLPRQRTIAQLLAATPEQRTQIRPGEGLALVRVVYQTPVSVTWRGATAQLTGRTLEEAFALENFALCQEPAGSDLRLTVRQSVTMAIEEVFGRIHKRIKGSAFKKTDFALALLAIDPIAWRVPTYITEGLRWLEEEVAPPAPEVPITTPATPIVATLS